MATERLLVLTALLAVAPPALAQPVAATTPEIHGPQDWRWYVPAPAAPPPVHTVHVTLGGSLRFTGLDPHHGDSTRQLLEYGWQSAHAPVMPSLGGDVEYLLTPIVDVGVAASWARGDHAAGLDATNDRVSTTTTRVAVVGRLHWARGRAFIPEPRLDVGVVRRTVELHGVAATDALPYLRGGIDWRLGTRTAGAQVSVGFTVSGRASSQQLDPAIGGLDVGIGPYLRF